MGMGMAMETVLNKSHVQGVSSIDSTKRNISSPRPKPELNINFFKCTMCEVKDPQAIMYETLEYTCVCTKHIGIYVYDVSMDANAN